MTVLHTLHLPSQQFSNYNEFRIPVLSSMETGSNSVVANNYHFRGCPKQSQVVPKIFQFLLLRWSSTINEYKYQWRYGDCKLQEEVVWLERRWLSIWLPLEMLRLERLLLWLWGNWERLILLLVQGMWILFKDNIFLYYLLFYQSSWEILSVC